MYKIMLSIYFVFLLVSAQLDGSQTSYEFVTAYGGDSAEVGFSIIETYGKGLAVCGYTKSFGAGAEDVLVIKLNERGEIDWAKTYGGPSKDIGYGIRQTIDSGFIVCGYTESSGAGLTDLFVMKLDTLGNVDWAYTYGGPEKDELIWMSHPIEITSNKGAIICGITKSFGAGQADGLVFEIDSLGGVIWATTYGDTGSDYLCDIELLSDGNIIVSGFTESWRLISPPDYTSYWLTKITPFGDTLWSKVYFMGSWDIVYSGIESSNNEIVLCGETYAAGPGLNDFVILKLTPFGEFLWAKTYGGSGYDYAHTIMGTPDGGFLICGNNTSFPNQGCWIMKVNPDGNVIWSKIFSGANIEVPYGMTLTSDNKIVICGYTKSFGVQNDELLVLKLAEDASFTGTCYIQNWSPEIWTPAKGIDTVLPTLIPIHLSRLSWNNIVDTPVNLQVTPICEVRIEEIVTCKLNFRFECKPNLIIRYAKIDYFIDKGIQLSEVRLFITDVTGKIVQEFRIDSHNKSIVWDKNDTYSKRILPGIYFLKFTSPKFNETKKIIVL